MPARWLQTYYMATPVFWLIDIVWGINVRAAGFESYPVFKHLYFAVCLGCALAVWKLPAWSGLIGQAESAVNILSLILGVMGPYYKFLGSFPENSGAIQNPISMPIIVNFILAGSAACFSFYSGQKSFSSRPANPPRP